MCMSSRAAPRCCIWAPFTATIMSANVFFIIMPNQRIVVADLKAGRTPDPKYGKIAKQRSTHNNYLTLPVLFLMLSNHYPLVFATEYNWIIASLVFLMGVTIRHWFNTNHARKGNPHWTWFADGAAVPDHRLAVDRADAARSPEEAALQRPGADLCFGARASTMWSASCRAAARCAMPPNRAMRAFTGRPRASCWKPRPRSPHEARRIYLQAGRHPCHAARQPVLHRTARTRRHREMVPRAGAAGRKADDPPGQVAVALARPNRYPAAEP